MICDETTRILLLIFDVIHLIKSTFPTYFS